MPEIPEESTVRMLYAIPALPVKNIGRSVEFYRDKLGFTVVHQEAGFAVLRRDAAEIHLWAASDEDWRTRSGSSPVVSGAESFIAGTASCRVAVEQVDELHAVLRPLGILHRNAPLRDQWWGSREFGVVDLDNNLVTFFENRKTS
jgi:catechol 2,3-dioxygenase-like lactoylglutathione lyase family enzyme